MKTSANDNKNIASDTNELLSGAEFDVVVIGSGYGGSIAASRMARAGQKVCLLERGLEKRPGQYPNTLEDMTKELHVQSGEGSTQNPLGMFDFKLYDDVSVLVGNGLGGTSLINANVALEAHHFTHDWPTVFKKNPGILKKYYATAKKYLGTNTYPSHFPKLKKVEALDQSAKSLHLRAEPAPINVNFNRSGKNSFGVEQKTCNLCGDCCSGCNYDAKNTTLMNYLPDAKNHGAKIYCGVSVTHFAQTEDNNTKVWCIHADIVSPENNTTQKITIHSTILILAAGTLGTTEIMLRSQKAAATGGDKNTSPLAFSKKLGENFSGNGDVLAFGYNNYLDTNNKGEPINSAINGVGLGTNSVPDDELPGPCITSVIKIKDENEPEKDLVVEEGVIPGAFSSMLPAAFFFNAVLKANFSRYGPSQAGSRLNDIKDLAEAIQNNPSELSELSYTGAINRTQSYLVMSEDNANGQLELGNNNKIKVVWPNAGNSQSIKRDNDILDKLNDAAGGQFIHNPLWDKAFGKKLITVHPLGGCPMGDDIHTGVVNEYGQVFHADEKPKPCTNLYEGLYICDGSILPHSIRVNPLLTISALAERSCEHICDTYGLEYKTALHHTNDNEPHQHTDKPSDKNAEIAPHPEKVPTDSSGINAITEKIKQFIGSLLYKCCALLIYFFPKSMTCETEFSEIMQGFIQTNNINEKKPEERISKSFELAFNIGKQENNTLTLELKIKTKDLQAFLQDPKHFAEAEGILTADNLLAEKSSYTSPIKGQVCLLETEISAPNTWLMTYKLKTEDQLYSLYGEKQVHWTPDSHWWNDLSKLSVSIYSIKNHELIAKGIAILPFNSLLKQIQSVRYHYTKTLIKWLSRFSCLRYYFDKVFSLKIAALFGNIVFRAYGKLLSLLSYTEWNEFKENNKTARHLNTIGQAETHWITTQDNFTIKLTRYSCDQKQDALPVILAPGMGVNASSFATTTVDENIVEFLNSKKRQVDVWLLDYRASFDSTSSKRDFCVDDIAQYDWPAAIEKVLEVSGHKQVQAIVHCVGSMSLLMSLLKGYTQKEKIRSIASSQLTLHPITNWLNGAKADLNLVHSIKNLVPDGVVPMEIEDSDEQKKLDALLYAIPVPKGEECNSAICRRIFSVYGPSFLHSQLNYDTHIALHEWFKDISATPFEQLSKMIGARRALDSEGLDTYLKGNDISNLSLPIDFIAGQLNLEFLPETSQLTYNWLAEKNSDYKKYSRKVFAGYGHMDCFIGKNANRDIFPYLYDCLVKNDHQKQ